MIKLKKLPITPEKQLRSLHWDWMLGKDTMKYITDDVVLVRDAEAEAYADAANRLYGMFVEAGQYIIDKNRFEELGIPPNLVEMIKLTWEDDRNLHLYGRFDLAGGMGGKEVKLIEFNADTATCIPETSVVQWAHLQANGLKDSMQFNSLYELIVENFKRLKKLNADLDPTLLISTMKGFPEDDTNTTILGEAAQEAGFIVKYKHIDEIEFSPDEGIFIENERKEFEQFNFWFKLVPWEFIANDEPELMTILNSIVKNRRAVIINPAYTLLFQSKGMLKTLWDLYPHHPLLLQTSEKPLAYKECVEKVMFGREGANVKIIDRFGKSQLEEAGEYGNQKRIYQEYVEFVKDFQDNFYQAGVFFAYEACGLGFRRGGKILGNTAQFVGHIVD